MASGKAPAVADWENVDPGDWETVGADTHGFVGPRQPPGVLETALSDVVGMPAALWQSVSHPIQTLKSLGAPIRPVNAPVPAGESWTPEETLGHFLSFAGTAGLGKGLTKGAQIVSAADPVKTGVGLILRPKATIGGIVKDAIFGNLPPTPETAEYQPFRPSAAIARKIAYGGPAENYYSNPNPMPTAQPGRLAQIPTAEELPTPPQPFKPSAGTARKMPYGGPTAPDYSEPNPMPKAQPGRLAQTPAEEEVAPEPREPFRTNPKIQRLIRYGGPTKEAQSRPRSTQRRGINRAMIQGALEKGAPEGEGSSGGAGENPENIVNLKKLGLGEHARKTTEASTTTHSQNTHNKNVAMAQYSLDSLGGNDPLTPDVWRKAAEDPKSAERTRVDAALEAKGFGKMKDVKSAKQLHRSPTDLAQDIINYMGDLMMKNRPK